MPFDIITIQPTVAAGTFDADGEVAFNLTSFTLPAHACKVHDVFLQVADTGFNFTNADGIELLFFQKNTQPTLGTLVTGQADISAADIVANQLVESVAVGINTNNGSPQLDTLTNAGLLFANPSTGVFNAFVLKSVNPDFTMFLGGVFNNVAGSPNFGGTDTLKVMVHVEY